MRAVLGGDGGIFRYAPGRADRACMQGANTKGPMQDTLKRTVSSYPSFVAATDSARIASDQLAIKSANGKRTKTTQSLIYDKMRSA